MIHAFYVFPLVSLSPSDVLLLAPVLPPHPAGRGLAECGHLPLMEGMCGQGTALCLPVKLPLYKSLKYLVPITLTNIHKGQTTVTVRDRLAGT